jgi:lipopolysaccharide export LptBFGC system permease protein LptF
MVGVDWAFDLIPMYDRNRDFSLSRPEDPYAAPLGRYASKTARWLVWKGWFWLLASGSIVALTFVLRSARSVEAAALFFGCICVMVPHLLMGQGALARYHFLPFVLSLVAALIALPGLMARLKRSPSPAS